MKAIKKIRKGSTRLLNIIPNPDLEKLVDQILEVTQKGFYYYPEAPEVNFTSTIPWIPYPLEAGPYQQTGEENFNQIPDKEKALKQIVKGKKNIGRGFQLLKEANESLYNDLQLHKPLDLVTQYASNLESYLLQSRQN